MLFRSVEWFGRAAEAHDAAGEPRIARRLALRKARSLFESGRYEAGLRAADELAATENVEPELRFEAEVMVAGLLTVQDGQPRRWSDSPARKDSASSPTRSSAPGSRARSRPL